LKGEKKHEIEKLLASPWDQGEGEKETTYRSQTKWQKSMKNDGDRGKTRDRKMLTRGRSLGGFLKKRRGGKGKWT